jgi:probable HAF family extracellular repeat protein
MRTRLVRITVLGLVVAASGAFSTAAGGAPPAPTYRVEDLGTLKGDYASVAMGINRFGDVVGSSLGPNGWRAFLYTDAAGMTALPAPAGRPRTAARAVNDADTVVGTASTGGSDIGHAVRWQSGTASDLGTLGTGSFSDAGGVNAAGVTVGSSYTVGGGLLGIHAFRHDGSGMVDLTPTADSARALGINDSGQVAGYRESRAFRLTGTTFTDLGVAPGFGASFGTAINRSGQVAGNVITSTGNSEQIFRYTDGAGMVILGGLGEFNRALGINSAGDVVGWGRPGLVARQGFLYTDANGMQGLNALIGPAAGWFVLGAGAINDAGQIAGWASSSTGQDHAVRLTPTGPIVAPAAPSALTGTVLSRARVRLTWTDNATNEDGFRIERSLGTQGKFVLLAPVGANATTYTDKTAKAGRVYRYRVRASNTAGPSAWSNTITVTDP